MKLRKAVIAVLCVLVALSVAEATLSKRDKKKIKSKSSDKKVFNIPDRYGPFLHVYMHQHKG